MGTELGNELRKLREKLKAQRDAACAVHRIDDAFVEAVEGRVGLGSEAWDVVDPKELILHVIEEYLFHSKTITGE